VRFRRVFQKQTNANRHRLRVDGAVRKSYSYIVYLLLIYLPRRESATKNKKYNHCGRYSGRRIARKLKSSTAAAHFTVPLASPVRQTHRHFVNQCRSVRLYRISYSQPEPFVIERPPAVECLLTENVERRRKDGLVARRPPNQRRKLYAIPKQISVRPFVIVVFRRLVTR